jgi:hypothetical protein
MKSIFLMCCNNLWPQHISGHAFHIGSTHSSVTCKGITRCCEGIGSLVFWCLSKILAINSWTGPITHRISILTSFDISLQVVLHIASLYFAVPFSTLPQALSCWVCHSFPFDVPVAFFLGSLQLLHSSWAVCKDPAFPPPNTQTLVSKKHCLLIV